MSTTELFFCALPFERFNQLWMSMVEQLNNFLILEAQGADVKLDDVEVP